MTAVSVRAVVGDAADHTFGSILTVAAKPAAVLLPVAGILLVTSEWSQRTGMITFALAPVRSRVIGAKLIASLVLAVAMLAMVVVVTAAGVLVAAPGVEGAWSDAPTLSNGDSEATAAHAVGRVKRTTMAGADASRTMPNATPTIIPAVR